MNREEGEAQFIRVKLSCQTFTRNPCTGALKPILESVEIEDRIHSLVGSYIMYPICLHLKLSEAKLQENFVELAFKIMYQTLKRTNVTQLKSFLEMFSIFCFFLDSKSPNFQSRIAISEEIKCQILLSFSALFKSTDSDVVRQFYGDTQYKKQFGLLLHLLFKELELKQGNKIPFLVINNLMSLLYHVCQFRPVRYIPNKSLFNTTLQYEFLWTAIKNCTESYQIQSEMAYFIPSITSKLINFILTHAQLSASLIAAAILAFANFIAYTCNDKFCKHILEKETELPLDLNEDGLYVNLNKDWWEKTSLKLSSLYVNVTQICIAHDSFKTRLCLLESAAVLLANCQLSLNSLTTGLIDTIVVMSADSDRCVNEMAVRIISSFSELPALNSFNSLLLRIEDLIYSLPKVVHSLNDANKLPILRLLSGYLKLIGKIQIKIGNTNIRMKECIKNLVKTLTSVLEFDISDDSILNQIIILSVQKETDLNTLKIKFINLEEISIQAIIEILHTVGMYCEFGSILSYIFELAEKERIRKRLIFILNHLIIGGGKTRNVSEIASSIEMIIPMYLQCEWFEDLDKSSYVLLQDKASFYEKANLPTILALKNRTLQQILILDGLGHFAISLGQKFQPFLVSTIFPLLEKSNNPNPYLQAQSYDSLHKLCTALKYDSIHSLIHDNADYVTNVISLQFFQECTSQPALDVLQSVFCNSSGKLLSRLEDSVRYLLKSIRFYHSHDESVILLPTLVVISNQLFKWQPAVDVTDTTPDYSTENLIQEYKEYLESYHPEEKDNLDTKGTCIYEEKPPNSLESTLCLNIIDSVSYYLNFPTAKITTFALKITTNCILALSAEMDNALPILHRIWPQFISCAKTNSPVILIASLDCLAQLSHYFGKFLMSRSEKDLWPFFIDILSRLSDHSKNCYTHYLHTQDYKIQLALIQTLPRIAFDLKGQFNQFHNLVTVYYQYLSLSQPAMLRAKAIEGIEILAKINPGTIYLLKTLLQPSEYGIL